MRTTVFAVLLVLFTVMAQAKIYRWVDGNGSIHFSDKPYSEKAREIEINGTGIQLDGAPSAEEPEPSLTTGPVAEKPLPPPAGKAGATTGQVETEQQEDKAITEEDYKITTTIGKLGADLISISGRIGSGPKCYELSVIAMATNDNGLTAEIKDQVRKSSSFGSVTFEGTAKAVGSAEDRGFWKVDSVKVSCNDQ